MMAVWVHGRPLSLISAFSTLKQNRFLIGQLTRREVTGRYKGSVLGVVWSFLTPLLLLAVYTFVFSVVFKARWGGAGATGGRAEYALFMFVGLIVHGIFAECINRAPSLVVGQANYVKKMIFPLEVLPFVNMGSALFHALVSVGVLLLGQLLTGTAPCWTIIFLPLVVLPLLLFTMGVSWMLASLGVFLRDISQVVGLVTAVMLFLSPVFYPTSALSGKAGWLLKLNPLTWIIEQAREVALLCHLPDPVILTAGLALGVGVYLAGFALFQKTRKGFADVL